MEASPVVFCSGFGCSVQPHMLQSILSVVTDGQPAMPGLAAISLIAVLPFLVVAAWRDLLTRTIPDRICIALAMVGLAVRVAAGPWPVVISLAIALAFFISLALLHAVGGFGGGDVKLASAVALGLSPLGVYRFVIITIFAGGILAFSYMILRSRFRAGPAAAGSILPVRLLRIESWRIRRHGTLPYGIAIACGGAWAVLTSFQG